MITKIFKTYIHEVVFPFMVDLMFLVLLSVVDPLPKPSRFFCRAKVHKVRIRNLSPFVCVRLERTPPPLLNQGTFLMSPSFVGNLRAAILCNCYTWLFVSVDSLTAVGITGATLATYCKTDHQYQATDCS